MTTVASDSWGNEGGEGWSEGLSSDGATAPGDGFDFDASHTDPDKVGGHGTVEKVGKYHFEVVDCKSELDTVDDKGRPRTPSVNYTLRVLESVPGQSPAGFITWHRLYVGEKGGGRPKQGCVDAMVDWMLAVGRFREVATEGGPRRFINTRTGDSKFNVNDDLLACKGEQLIGHVKIEKDDQYGDKVKLPFSGGAWRLDAPAVAEIPKNKDAADLWNPPTGRGEVRFPAATEAAPTKRGGGGRKKAEAAPAANPQAQATQPQQPSQQQQPQQQQKPAPVPPTPPAPAAPAVADDDF